MSNTICHIEFDVTDIARSQSFFEALFGWSFRAFGDMVVFAAGDDHIGGMTKVDTVKAGDSPSVWFDVADLDEKLATAAKLGAKTLSEKNMLPGVGFTAQVADPDGNPIGLVQFVKSD
ncbi:MAG: VOC family protein [Fimbriimonadaceae bacterium]|nr:VOC family protein [Fimbriimonadaceae bacterium]